LSGVEIVLVLALIAAGATVQGCTGIGIGLVAAPGLVAIDAGFVPGPILIVGMVVGARHVIAERHHADWSALKNCARGIPAGLVAALVVLTAVDERTMAIIVGLTTAVAAVGILVSPPVRRTTAVEIGAGSVCTFAAVTAGLPGPPLVVAFSTLTPNALRFLASAFISTIALIALAALPASGNFRRPRTRTLGAARTGRPDRARRRPVPAPDSRSPRVQDDRADHRDPRWTRAHDPFLVMNSSLAHPGGPGIGPARRSSGVEHR